MSVTEQNNNLDQTLKPSSGSTGTSESAPETTPTVIEKPVPCQVPAPEMSLGEKRFNNVFYNAMNYWLNLGMSMLITDFFTHDSQGMSREGFFTKHGTGMRWRENASQFLANLSSKTGLISAEHALSSARVGLKTLALNSGGWILLPFLWMAEQNKRAIVFKFNEWAGVEQVAANGSTTAPDGSKLTSEQIYIAQEQPKQSLGWALGRRALASGSTILTGIWLDKAAGTINPANGKLSGGGHNVETMIAGMANNTLSIARIPYREKFQQNPIVQRFLGYAALDTFYTWMTATIMHLTNGAGHEKKPKELAEEAHLPSCDKVKDMPATPAVSGDLSRAEKIKREQEAKPLLAAAASHTDRARSGSEQNLQLAP